MNVVLLWQVSGHAELAWLLGCRTPMGWLNRMTQWKVSVSISCSSSSLLHILLDSHIIVQTWHLWLHSFSQSCVIFLAFSFCCPLPLSFRPISPSPIHLFTVYVYIPSLHQTYVLYPPISLFYVYLPSLHQTYVLYSSISLF